jgi:glycerol-3-phosphate O-acyltransferase
MNEITARFFSYIEKMSKNSKMYEDTEITPENVFQVAHKSNRDLLYESVKVTQLEGSTILGADNLKKLYELALSGKSCMILSEHVSNLDVPEMFVTFYDYPDQKLKEIFEKIIFIAGVKLNENPVVKMYTEMFTRMVIFPARSLVKIQDNKEYKKELELAKKINLRATRMIKDLRTQGNIFLLYPAGTRYRPWMPETKKAIKETASYLASFDYFCCSSINGNSMVPMEHEDMTKEKIDKDVIVYSFGEVQNAKEYIEKITSAANLDSGKNTDNKKQTIGDKIMEDIDALHNKAEEYRSKYLKK